ncbi:MAG: hypothetical protein AAB348_00780 [Patescibacteria group bacterium]
MKKKILALALSLIFFGLIIVGPTLANDFGLKATGDSIGGYDTSTDGEAVLLKTIQKIISAVLSMLGIIFLLIMLYAGLRWLTSRGKEELIERAKNAVEAAVIGLIVVVLSYAISRWVLDYLISRR